MNLLLWGFAAALSGFFSVQILREWLNKRKQSHLAWTAGFVFYFFSALCSTWSYLSGWDPVIFKIWYVTGASLVAFLGAGQMYFTVKPGWAHAFLTIVSILTVAMSVKVFGASLDVSKLNLTGEEIGGTPLPRDARMFSPLVTIPGSIALIGGAFYTAVRYHSKSGLWIGIGSLIIALGGTLTRLDLPQFLPVGNSIGISLIYYGYVLSARRQPENIQLKN
jgi:hypothetical protein